ncbi:hypothetical protein PWR63_00315 [Paraburkholderia sp. A2WS-5]|uniref:hypothetical protein n=1 Tax=unclassified Paraburkholderia TaxID=2615204 RepID=UPI003B7BC2F0
MKHFRWLDAAGQWIGTAVHWSDLQSALRAGLHDNPEWVIVYETAFGFCCVYHDREIEFAHIDDFRAWAEQAGVQLYFIGL